MDRAVILKVAVFSCDSLPAQHNGRPLARGSYSISTRRCTNPFSALYLADFLSAVADSFEHLFYAFASTRAHTCVHAATKRSATCHRVLYQNLLKFMFSSAYSPERHRASRKCLHPRDENKLPRCPLEFGVLLEHNDAGSWSSPGESCLSHELQLELAFKAWTVHVQRRKAQSLTKNLLGLAFAPVAQARFVCRPRLTSSVKPGSGSRVWYET